MVESMIRYSKSGSSTSALKRLFQTPFFAHQWKRWNTLFQLPNSRGRSRHGLKPPSPPRAMRSEQRTHPPCEEPLLYPRACNGRIAGL
jgi:hypothetical protein